MTSKQQRGGAHQADQPGATDDQAAEDRAAVDEAYPATEPGKIINTGGPDDPRYALVVDVDPLTVVDLPGTAREHQLPYSTL